MGLFDIPVVERSPNGIVGLILMILLGGLGTIIFAFIALGERAEEKKNSIIVGVLQLLVAFVTFGIGHIWAIVWGVLVFVKSTDNTTASTPPSA